MFNNSFEEVDAELFRSFNKVNNNNNNWILNKRLFIDQGGFKKTAAEISLQ